MSSLLSSVKLREFKFDGSVGYPGEKGKLDFNGVMHNIKMAQRRKFPEEEICYAAIRAIVPGHPTRSYLEGEEDLSVDKVVAAFRSHFLQQDVTHLYNEMTRAVQGTGDKDTAYTFVAQMFSKRNTINAICRNKHVVGAKYGPELVQSEMQKAIYVGLTDEDIRSDLKHILRKDDLADNELLAAVTESMTAKKAHEELMQQREASKTGGKKKAVASAMMIATTADDDNDSSVQSGSSNTSKKSRKSKTGAGNSKDDFMSQLASVVGCELKNVVEPLQAQINELNQFRSSFQSSQQNSNKLNATAPPFQGSGASNGQKPKVATAPVNTAGAAGSANSDEFLGKVFRQVFENMMSQSSPSGQNSANPLQNQQQPQQQQPPQPPNRGFCNGVQLLPKCSICRAANAFYCNHCQICHGVDHRNISCPKRKDPTFVPLN